MRLWSLRWRSLRRRRAPAFTRGAFLLRHADLDDHKDIVWRVESRSLLRLYVPSVEGAEAVGWRRYERTEETAFWHHRRGWAYLRLDAAAADSAHVSVRLPGLLSPALKALDLPAPPDLRLRHPLDEVLDRETEYLFPEVGTGLLASLSAPVLPPPPVELALGRLPVFPDLLRPIPAI